MVYCCSLFTCDNKFSKFESIEGQIQLHRIPVHKPVLVKKWLEAIKRVNWKPTPYSGVCSEHFIDKDYILDEKGNRKRLRANAVPSIVTKSWPNLLRKKPVTGDLQPDKTTKPGSAQENAKPTTLKLLLPTNAIGSPVVNNMNGIMLMQTLPGTSGSNYFIPANMNGSIHLLQMPNGGQMLANPVIGNQIMVTPSTGNQMATNSLTGNQITAKPALLNKTTKHGNIELHNHNQPVYKPIAPKNVSLGDKSVENVKFGIGKDSQGSDLKMNFQKTGIDKYELEGADDADGKASNCIVSCRLCDKKVSVDRCDLLRDHSKNLDTRLGQKIKIILNSNEQNPNLSNYCCSNCSSKVQVCFSLLIEIQASDEVIRQAYVHVSQKTSVNTNKQTFMCEECKFTVTGIKGFIRHYEDHIFKKTVAGWTKDIKVTDVTRIDKIEPIPDEDNRLINIDDTKVVSGKKSSILQDVKSSSISATSKKDTLINELNTKRKTLETKKVDETSKHTEVLELDGDESSVVDGFGDANNDTDDSGDEVNVISDLPNDVIMSAEDRTDIKEEIEDDNINDLSDFSDNDSVTSELDHENFVSIVKHELKKVEDQEEAELIADKDGLYHCEPCKSHFEYRFLLHTHLKMKHKETAGSSLTKPVKKGKAAMVSCRYCDKNFTSKEWHHHVSDCRKLFFHKEREVLCHKCGRSYLPSKWFQHEKSHFSSGKRYSCAICGKSYNKKIGLKSHLGEHDESLKKVCHLCGKKLLARSFRTHMYKHEEKKIVCEVCGKRFTFNYSLQDHMRIHGKNDKPKKKYNSTTQNKKKCFVCKLEFQTTEELDSHLKEQHDGVDGNQFRAQCPKCDKVFVDMFTLRNHLKLIHGLQDEEIAVFKSFPQFREVQCDICKTMLTSDRKLEIHMRKEHGLTPHKVEKLKRECEKCGKLFSSKQALQNHVNHMHLHLKPITCKVCNEKFAKYGTLVVHMLKHTGEKPFQCEHCKKNYRQQGDMYRHLARHVRDGEIDLESATAINTSASQKIKKRRIFLKDSNIKDLSMYNKYQQRKHNQKPKVLTKENTMEVTEPQEEMFLEEGQEISLPGQVVFVNYKEEIEDEEMVMEEGNAENFMSEEVYDINIAKEEFVEQEFIDGGMGDEEIINGAIVESTEEFITNDIQSEEYVENTEDYSAFNEVILNEEEYPEPETKQEEFVSENFVEEYFNTEEEEYTEDKPTMSFPPNVRYVRLPVSALNNLSSDSNKITKFVFVRQNKDE